MTPRRFTSLTEADQSMRFDCDARIEVWVTMGDLEDDEVIQKLVKANAVTPVEQRIAAAKQRAAELARNELENVHGVTITADLDVRSVNVDRIDWVALVSPREEY